MENFGKQNNTGKEKQVDVIEEEKLLSNDDKLKKLASLHHKFMIRALGILSKRKLQDHAEDAVQEAYSKAAKYIVKFNHESTLETWFTRIVINEALMVLRRTKEDQMPVSSENNEDDLEFELIDKKQLTPEEILHVKETKELIHGAIQRLELPQQRQAIILNKIEGKIDSEIARETGINENTHRTNVQRGMKKMRIDLTKMLANKTKKK